MGGVAREGPAGYRHRALVALLIVWLLASSGAVGDALRSEWVPFGEVPTAEQVGRARSAARVAGLVAVLPPLAGMLLARRWGSAGWTAAFLVGLMLAVLGAGLLLALTGGG